MRVSIDRDDPGFSKDAYRRDVFLDGKHVMYCQTTDEEEGYIEVFLVGGEICFDASKGGLVDIDPVTRKPVVRRVSGKVTIKRYD